MYRVLAVCCIRWDALGGLTLVGCIGWPYSCGIYRVALPCEICQVALPLRNVPGDLIFVWPYFCRKYWVALIVHN